MKKLDELGEVIPPPADPKVSSTDTDWLDLFAHIGTRLPRDFVQFHKRYGDGYIYSLSHKMSANITIYGGGYKRPTNRSFSFRQQVPARLSDCALERSGVRSQFHSLYTGSVTATRRQLRPCGECHSGNTHLALTMRP